jgi:hypothetical protein
MIRAAGTFQGKRTLFFMLEEGNLARLRAGDPILVDAASMDPALTDLQIMICLELPGVREGLLAQAQACGASIHVVPATVVEHVGGEKP